MEFPTALRRLFKKEMTAPSENRSGWFPMVRESYAGAWQSNIVVNRTEVIANHAVFACVTLIASDIAKLRVKLVQLAGDGIWQETENPAYSPVLRRPNGFQSRIQFWESWVLSKLLRGNTYALKERDNRGVVTRLYILDPARVKPLVADDGSVFYELQADNVSRISQATTIPAREIIHDRINCIFHPLVGVSPIYANGLAATQGLSIQNNSAWFFANKSMPGAVLTAPGMINQETADRLKDVWDSNYSGSNAGKVAVLGDGLKFDKLPISAEDAQLVEQLKWSGEVICSTFHVPPYKVGIGPMPTYNNIQALNVEYYSQCLQYLIEGAELSLDEGLGLPNNLGVEFDLDGLLRMDAMTQMGVLKEGVSSGIMSPDEARRKINLASVPGGDSPYLQQQNYSLAALAKRDAQEDPFSPPESMPASTPDDESGADPTDEEIILGISTAIEQRLAMEQYKCLTMMQ